MHLVHTATLPLSGQSPAKAFLLNRRTRFSTMSAMGKSTREAKSKPLNRSLHAAKSAKQDEFYTQYNEGNGERQKPKAVGVIVDQVKHENNELTGTVTDHSCRLPDN